MFASCITRVQLYVNACNWTATVCAAAPLALADQLPLPRLYSALVRSSRKQHYIRIRPLQCVSVSRVRAAMQTTSCGLLFRADSTATDGQSAPRLDTINLRVDRYRRGGPRRRRGRGSGRRTPTRTRARPPVCPSAKRNGRNS